MELQSIGKLREDLGAEIQWILDEALAGNLSIEEARDCLNEIEERSPEAPKQSLRGSHWTSNFMSWKDRAGSLLRTKNTPVSF